MRRFMARLVVLDLYRRTGYKTGMPRSNGWVKPPDFPPYSPYTKSFMADPTSHPGWLSAAANKLRAFANGGEHPASTRPRVGLALSGGFARGIAHIGVIRTLFAAGIPIDVISGTSVGALIGIVYASGTPLKEMERIGLTTTFADFGRWTPSWIGLATNQRLEKYLKRFTSVTTFEQLQTPLSIATTDLNAGITVYYDSGPIAPVLRASCSYPGLFVPIHFDNRTLVDGFLTAPVPVEGCYLQGADVVIAVHLDPGNREQPRTFTDVLSRSFNIIQRYADVAWRQQADVIIEPDVQQFVWDDFSKTPQMVAAGEAATLAALPQIRAALAHHPEKSGNHVLPEPLATTINVHHDRSADKLEKK
jgi:NTE family protein